MNKWLTVTQVMIISVIISFVFALALYSWFGFWETVVIYLVSFVWVYLLGIYTPCADKKVHPWK